MIYNGYLFCERCRGKNISEKKLATPLQDQKVSKSKEKVTPMPNLSSINGDFSRPHMIMRNNAMFLLELASSAENTVNRHQRRASSSAMPSVSENGTPPDPVTPFGVVPPFQCLQALGADDDMRDRDVYEEVIRRHDGGVGGPSGIGQRVSEIYLTLQIWC